MVIFFKNKTLTQEDTEAITELLESGLSLREILFLLSSDSYLIKDIQNKAEKGENANELFKKYLDAYTKRLFSTLIKILPFEKAFPIALLTARKRKEQQKEIIKKIGYPFFLLMISLLGLYIFNLSFMPIMLDLLKSFSNNLSFFYTMKIICEFVCQFILLVILIGMFILLIFINKKRRVYNYMRLCQKWPNNFIIKVVSLYFVDELLLCQSLGYGTREAINLIRSFKEEMPLSSFIAYHVDNNFRKGMPLNEALALPYLDRQLQRYSDIAVFSKEGLKTLDKYCLVSRKKMTKMLKNSALAIQIMIYLFIAFLIIIIYQILFLPMQVLSKF